MNKKRPQIGFAFSGASSRSVFYIGFLEVLKEHNFPVDFIAAMSGSAIVAASYACGTMPDLKRLAFELNREVAYNLIERSKGKGGIYHLKKVEEMLRLYTKNMKFEEVQPRLALIATDVNAGEEVVLQVGDIARAVCASCTLPGIFEPQQWGNRTLVDGGVISTVPGNVAQQAGMDIVIGIHLDTTVQIFSKWHIALQKCYLALRKILLVNQAERLWQKVVQLLEDNNYFYYYPLADQFGKEMKSPNIFSVLNRAMDIASKERNKNTLQATFNCDLVIRPVIPKIPQWKRSLFLYFTDFTKTRDLYDLGRSTAQEYLPQLWQIVYDHEVKQQEITESLELLIQENESQRAQ